MAVTVKLCDDLVEDAKTVAAAEHRSVPEQIEYWARIGKAVLDNPDIPLRMIQDTMLSIEESKAGQVTPYAFVPATRSVTELKGMFGKAKVKRDPEKAREAGKRMIALCQTVKSKNGVKGATAVIRELRDGN